ncbi:MAG: uracil phosphoribosyltransferase [Butyricimonas virosa]|nr:uracil phosphoribosyltransferase [Butyricimonas virosa]
MVHIINKEDSVYNRFLAELRDKEIQKDPLRFRRNLERVGEVMAYEISKTFRYSTQQVQTPINVADVRLADEEVVVASVLRAGLPFHQGFLNYFDRSGSAFISARRKYKENHIDFEIRFDSIYTPSLEGKQLLLVDPMLATGGSIVVAYHELLKQGGRPAHTHIAAIVSSRQGIERLTEALKDEPVTVWTGALDEHLTESCYIDPGIGDAGDLAFGEKL